MRQDTENSKIFLTFPIVLCGGEGGTDAMIKAREAATLDTLHYITNQ